MAGGALVAIDIRAGDECVLIGLDRRSLDELAVDARVERNLSDQAFLRQRRVGDGYRHVSKMKPRQHGKGHENHAQDNSK